jgi:hypothetical protein
MSASERLAALQQAALTPPGEDDDYAEIVLEHERGSSGFNAAGAEAAKTVLNALPELVALMAAVEAVQENAFVMVEYRMGDGVPVAGVPMTEMDTLLAALASLEAVL